MFFNSLENKPKIYRVCYLKIGEHWFVVAVNPDYTEEQFITIARSAYAVAGHRFTGVTVDYSRLVRQAQNSDGTKTVMVIN